MNDPMKALRELLAEMRGDYSVCLQINEDAYRQFCERGAKGRMPGDTWARHCHRRKEQIAAALAALGGEQGQVPDAVREMLDEGWTLNYSADTGLVGFSHPQGGRQPVLEICKGRRNQGIGEFIVAALSLPPPPGGKVGG